MSESRQERKPSRTSILKTPKKANQSLDDSNSDTATYKDVREVRRVSFASSNFVKPFTADPEKNTIWDNTYEEEINQTDSKASDLHTETKSLNVTSFLVLELEKEQELDTNQTFGILKRTTTNETSIKIVNFEESNKENYVPSVIHNPFLTQDSLKLSDSLFKNGNLEMEVSNITVPKIETTEIAESNMELTYMSVKQTTSKIVQDMQLTCILPNEKDQHFKTINNLIHSNSAEDMQLTCVAQNRNTVISPEVHVAQNFEIFDPKIITVNTEQDMQLTCISENPNNESDMQLTSVIPETICANLNKLKENKRFDTKHDETSMQFTCVFPELTRANPNNLTNNAPIESNANETNMQFTCVFPDTIPANRNNIKDDAKYNETMQFTCVLPEITRANPNNAPIESNANETSMQFTCVFPEINPANQNNINDTTGIDSKHNESRMQFTCIFPDTIPADPNNIKDNAKYDETSMQFTCVLPEITRANPNSAPIESNANETSMQFTCVFPEINPTNQNNINDTVGVSANPNNKKDNVAIDSKYNETSMQVTSDSTNNFEDSDMQLTGVLSTEIIDKAQKSICKKAVTFGEIDMDTTNLLPLDKSESNKSEVLEHISVLSESEMNKHNTPSLNDNAKYLTNPAEEPEKGSVKPLFSFEIHRSSTLVHKNNPEVSEQTEKDSKTNENYNKDKKNFRLNPEVLKIDETHSTSFAMILNNSPYVEHPGKKIYSTCTKSSAGTAINIGKAKENSPPRTGNYQTDDTVSICDTSDDKINETIYAANRRDSLFDTSPPLIENSDISIAIEAPSIIGKTYLLPSVPNTENKTNLPDLDSTPNDLSNELHKLLINVQECLNRPPIIIPKINARELLGKLDEADAKIESLLETLKFPEIELIDLEELDKLEEDFECTTNTSRFSDGILSADSGNNVGEENRLSDIEVPKSLEERVKEAALRSRKFWTFVKCEGNLYYFYTLEGGLPFKVKVHPDLGLVEDIYTYTNLKGYAFPVLFYECKYLSEKLKTENLLLVLGGKFDILTLLDYICICTEEMEKFYNEFSQLEVEYGPTHKFRMNPDFSLTIEVLNTKYVIWWIITIQLSVINLGSIDRISCTHKIEEVDEKYIQNIAKSCTGSKCLRNFIANLDQYVEKTGKIIQENFKLSLLNPNH